MGERIDPVQCCTDIVPLIGIVSDSLSYLFWIEQPEDRQMNAKKTKDTLQRLSSEYENLIKSINRSRLAAKEIKLENKIAKSNAAPRCTPWRLMRPVYSHKIDSAKKATRLLVATCQKPPK